MDTNKTLEEHNEVIEEKEPTDEHVEPPTDEDTQALVDREPDYMMDEDEMMDRTIEVSEKLAKYEKSLDMVLNFIIKRCYTGDFISHDKQDTPLEERTANINNAAAERIARDLGIRESNRSPLKKEIDPKTGHYTYTCTGDFSFRGQKISAVGQATTRNAFYSKAYGKQKPISEIREDYVRTECLRDLVKQGVRKIFGLRKIPLLKLQELGYDISKVKCVNFKSSEGSQAAKNPQATKAVHSEKWITLMSFEDRTYGDKSFTIFKTEGGKDLSCWHQGDTLKQLKESVGNAQVRVTLIQKGKYWNIDKLLEVGAL